MRTIKEIAQEIQSDWKTANKEASQYLIMMEVLKTMNDKFINKDATTIVINFLVSARGYRSDKAKRIKNELKNLIKCSNT